MSSSSSNKPVTHYEQRVQVPRSWGGRGVVRQSLCAEEGGRLTSLRHKVTCSLCRITLGEMYGTKEDSYDAD